MPLPRLVRRLLAALALTGAARAADSISYPASSGPGNGRHLVFLTGDEEYRGEEGLPMLAKILSQRHGFRCTVLFALDPDGTINPDRSERVGDAAQLATADGIVMMLRFRRWPDEAMGQLATALARGVPVIGLRTSTHAFLFPAGHPTRFPHFNQFGRNVLGEGWVSHWGPNRRGATRGVVEPGAEGHPVLRGVRDVFGDSGVYEVHPAADATILMRGAVLGGMRPEDVPDTYRKKRKVDGIEQGVNDPMMPVAWVREPQAGSTSGRVVCTTLGAATDLESEGLRRLVVNGVLWAFRLEVPAAADVRPVDPYQPSPYAFKGYRRGLRPDDHALGRTLPPGTGRPPP